IARLAASQLSSGAADQEIESTLQTPKAASNATPAQASDMFPTRKAPTTRPTPQIATRAETRSCSRLSAGMSIAPLEKAAKAQVATRRPSNQGARPDPATAFAGPAPLPGRATESASIRRQSRAELRALSSVRGNEKRVP